MRENQSFIQNKQFTSVAALTGVFVTAHAAINIFIIGGEDFVMSVNYTAPFLFSAYAALLAVWTWTYTSDKDSSKRTWAGMALGLSLWALGDFTSANYTLFTNEEIPEISLADVFWLAGYIPLALALVWRSRSFGIKPTRHETETAIAVMIIIMLISGYFVILPTIQASSSYDLIALINVLYPIGDALMGIIALYILLTLGKGSFSSVWQIIAIGLVLRSFGDLMYNYAAGNDLYWTDNHLNLATILTDIPYSAAYLVLALGIYNHRLISRQAVSQKATNYTESDTFRQKLGHTDVLVFTNNQGKVAFISNNFLKLVKAPDKTRFLGSTLKTILGLSDELQREIMEDLGHLGYVRNRPVRVKTQSGGQVEVILTAAASQIEGQFTGADIALRVELDEEHPEPETTSIANQIYARAGVRHNENLQFAKDYVRARTLALRDLTRRMNGDYVARTLTDLFNQTAQEQNLRVWMDEEDIFFPEDESPKQLASSMPALTRTVTQYAEKVVGYQAIESELKNLESKMDASALRILESFGVR
jgi:hypothetical protein